MDHEPLDTDCDGPALHDGGLSPGSDLPPRDEAARREAELVAYRERRARRIAELGLGSHLNQPPPLLRRARD